MSTNRSEQQDSGLEQNRWRQKDMMKQCRQYENVHNDFRRHDLVFLKEDALIHNISDPVVKKLLSHGVPAIVKMQTSSDRGDTLLELGLSSWVRSDEERLRCSFSIAPKDVRRRMRPWEVLEDILRRIETSGRMETPERIFAEGDGSLWNKRKGILDLLSEISQKASELGLLAGVYGSFALEGMTDMPYLHEGSDLDLYFLPQKALTEETLREFCCWMKERAEGWSCTVDCEISIGRGYSVKLTELLSGQMTVLAKGFYDVVLLDRQDALTQMVKIYGRLDRERFRQTVVKAVICEAASGPKPGLVDRYNQGAHQDMDLYTFITSATALGPFFEKCFATGIKEAENEPDKLFRLIRPLGIQGETTMFSATGGINTHKGLIFSLGLLSCAYGRFAALAERGGQCITDADFTAEKLLRFCGAMAVEALRQDFKHIASENLLTGDPAGSSAVEGDMDLSHGEKLYVRYGVTGARGVALGGYWQVWQDSYPLFCSRMKAGFSLDQSAVDALLALIPLLDDTNLLHRGGPEGLAWAKGQAEKAISLGGMTTEAGRQFIRQMDRDFTEKRLSPGGAADLLAMVLTLYFLLYDESR